MLLPPGENADLPHFKNADLPYNKKTPVPRGVKTDSPPGEKTRVARVENAPLPHARSTRRSISALKGHLVFGGYSRPRRAFSTLEGQLVAGGRFRQMPPAFSLNRVTVPPS